jgi:protein TonB
MGYQALLFCPDEKTARTVTQVLSELDFTVVPCTEPFGAVKKLMAEHFDAVVVDCDNEQNATLLFKSARNAPNNQSALAVAVVEGQAGVAKAFRIGANLVLTKPINVEQAKGTLRVARGLLRKGESTRPAAAATTAAPKPAPSAPAPPKPALVTPSVAAPHPAVPTAPQTVPPPQKQILPTSFAVSASSAITEAAKSAEPAHANLEPATTFVEQTPAPKIAPATEPRPELISSKLQVVAPTFSVATSAGAASAPAPAREAQPHVPATEQTSPIIPQPESPVEAATGVSSLQIDEASAPSSAPTLTFGGTVGSETESASGGSKKTLLVVAAIVLIAAAGYYAWTQWAKLHGTAGVSNPVAVRLAAPAPAVPQALSSTAIAPSSAPSILDAGTSSGTAAASSSTADVPPTGSAKASSTVETARNTPAHQDKVNSSVDSSKPALSAAAATKPPAKAEVQPIVIKNSSSQLPTAKAEPTPDAPAPSITAIASSGDGGSLPNLMDSASKTQAPVLQVMNVSQGVSQGLVIKKTAPSYPPNALHMGIEGQVQLLATISKTGDISSVKILSGDAALVHAAVDAVKQWKYKPYLLDGSPVEIQTQVTVNFKLPR